MNTSRRRFVSTAVRGLGGAALATAWTSDAIAVETAGGEASPVYKIFPIGKVEKRGQEVRLRLFDEFADGLLGLDGWSHVNVFYWFDRNDTSPQRRTLRVRPRGDANSPLTGVFACRAPVRPNLIALSVCKILSVGGSVVTVDGLDAFDATPIIDLKPFIPPDAPERDVRVPDWARPKRPATP